MVIIINTKDDTIKINTTEETTTTETGFLTVENVINYIRSLAQYKPNPTEEEKFNSLWNNKGPF
jgi:hypothetical protein